MKKSKINNAVITALMIVLVLIILIPVIFLVSTSFKTQSEILSSSSFFPEKATIENYGHVLITTPFPTFLKSSAIVAVLVTLGTTVVGSMAAYSLARYRKKYKVLNGFSQVLLLLQMFPLVLIMLPLYSIFQQLGLVETRISLVLAHSTFTLPFAIWLMMGFFDTIPRDIEESGIIDGCSPFQVFLRLVVPISSPGIASAAIFSFINSWNEYMMSNIFVKTDALKTLPVGLQAFIQQYGAEWGSLMAAATMTLLPVLIFLVFTQKYIVQGLTAGAVKG